jgi:hypothetical protein
MRAAAPQAAAKAGGLTCATAGMTAVATAKKGPRTTVSAGRGHWCGITKGAREHHHRQRSGRERFRHGGRSFQHKLYPRTAQNPKKSELFNQSSSLAKLN